MATTTTIVKISEDSASDGAIELSPFDHCSMGRAIPMLWCYTETLDTSLLLESLAQTLVAYPVLSGRYNGERPPTAVTLNNAGVPVEIATWDNPEVSSFGALSHLPINSSKATYFPMDTHVPFIPEKQGMDPDTNDPEAPLIKVKITLFPAGGTVIGTLFQHGVVDAEAVIIFMRNWSRTFRNFGLDPVPVHDRVMVNRLSTGDTLSEAKPDDLKVDVVPAGAQSVPAFAGVMPKIMGRDTCIVPLTSSMLKKMKAEASEGLPEGTFVSTDDVVSARIWQALCAMRCAQLGIARDDATIITTISRAWNFRARCDPPLGGGYCANGVSQVWTEMSVKELLGASTTEIAVRLRLALKAHTSKTVGIRAQWLSGQQKTGARTPQQFDANALTFIISSWRFDWEGVDFNAHPVAFDHGAHVPIVAVIAPRGGGDGLNVYATGPRESLATFCDVVTGNTVVTDDEYFIQHKIPRLVNGLIRAMLVDRPVDVVDYSLSWFEKKQCS